jgi:hypothetical protein
VKLRVPPEPLKPPKIERASDGPEISRLWKRFQTTAALPEKDQRAVLRLINSLASLNARQHLRKAGRRYFASSIFTSTGFANSLGSNGSCS